MSKEKLTKIVKSLITNTKDKKIDWQESTIGENAVEYAVKDATIVISNAYNSYDPSEESRYIELAIYNNNGNQIDQFTGGCHGSGADSSDLQNLYETARRQALKVEEVLDSIVADISKISQPKSAVQEMNGLYKATYSMAGSKGEGIVFMDNGKFYGSDASHAFYGTYTLSASTLSALTFSANLTRMQYSQHQEPLGGGGNKLSITGTIKDGKVQGQGTIPGVPVKMDITLQRIANI